MNNLSLNRGQGERQSCAWKLNPSGHGHWLRGGRGRAGGSQGYGGAAWNCSFRALKSNNKSLVQ